MDDLLYRCWSGRQTLISWISQRFSSLTKTDRKSRRPQNPPSLTSHPGSHGNRPNQSLPEGSVQTLNLFHSFCYIFKVVLVHLLFLFYKSSVQCTSKHLWSLERYHLFFFLNKINVTVVQF